MARRVTHTFHFPDYSVPELVSILFKMAEKDNLKINEDAGDIIKLVEECFLPEVLAQHNAGFCCRLYRSAKDFADKRIASFIGEDGCRG